MPTAGSPRPAGRRLQPSERAARVRFRRAIALMVMTLLIPGSAQLVAGNKRVGRIAMRIWMAAVALTVVTVVVGMLSHGLLFRLLVRPGNLLALQLLLIGLALGWAFLFMDAWRLGNPLSLMRKQRLAAVALNGVLTFTVAGVLLFGAHLVAVNRDFVLATFSQGEAVDAHQGRYNVLLLGGDAGAGRWGLRPDSMNVVSIDAETGKTVIVGLPRNMANFPFAPGSVMDKEFPAGFDCDGCYLNGVSTWAQDHAELFGDSETPGIDATVMAIEGITGLEMSYWALVDLKGFRNLVDAVGGVKLNVRERIPVGGLGADVTGYIEPGVRRLNGHDTLWFARAREGSDDYSRMARQKCVMNAMLHQTSPQRVLLNFSEIAEAGSSMVSTSLPATEAGRFVDLALKARDQKVASVSLVPPAITTADPDIDKIHEMVETAIGRSDGSIEPAPKKGNKGKKASGGTVTGGSVGTLSDGYAANQADDLGATC